MTIALVALALTVAAWAIEAGPDAAGVRARRSSLGLAYAGGCGLRVFPKPRATHIRAKCRPRYSPNVWNSRLAVDGGATCARNGLYDLSLFAGTGVLDKVPDVDDAVYAGVGALQAGVMRLYGVVVIPGGLVRVGCARLIHVNLLSRLAGSRGAATPAGPFTL